MWTYDGLKRRYNRRINALMRNIKKACEDAGLHVEGPYECFGDDYRWELVVQLRQGDPVENNVDVSFTICESEQYDGTEHGVNFSVDVVKYSGEILGGMTPYNYTDECWVDLGDLDAIDKRFAIMEHADPADIPPLIIGRA